MNKTPPLQFKLDKFHRDLIDRLADQTGLSMTDIIKIALRELAKNEQALAVIAIKPITKTAE